MNSDFSGVATGSTQNPWAIVAGTAANHGTHRVIGVPRAYNWVDVFPAVPTGSLTAGAFRLFGKVPHRPVSSARSWPQDIDPANYADVSNSAVGIWIQLPSIGSDGVLSYAAVTTATTVGTTRTGLIIGLPTTFQLRGVESILAVISSGATSGVLLGMFHG